MSSHPRRPGTSTAACWHRMAAGPGVPTQRRRMSLRGRILARAVQLEAETVDPPLSELLIGFDVGPPVGAPDDAVKPELRRPGFFEEVERPPVLGDVEILPLERLWSQRTFAGVDQIAGLVVPPVAVDRGVGIKRVRNEEQRV